ncbi:MAG: class I SAM-dependent methyltransferase [Candidatus Levybacteria bacterium]|nr:class I SAM-dependent methyltransferase [Candidatus Levybacteria bacterium]
MSRNYLNKQVLRENALVYDDYYQSGIIDGWEEHDKVYNFGHLFKIAKKAKMSLCNASVLDVGCGTGDIIPYLQKQGVKKYIGIDIYKPALRIAKKKYPQETFVLIDILDTTSSSSRTRRSRFTVPLKARLAFGGKSGMTTNKFDFVLSSGAISIKLKSLDNYEFLEAMVRKMWKMSRHGLAFNVLTDEDIAPAKHLFYYSIEKVRKLCKQIAPDAKIAIRRTPIHNRGYEDEAQIHVYMTKSSQLS